MFIYINWCLYDRGLECVLTFHELVTFFFLFVRLLLLPTPRCLGEHGFLSFFFYCFEHMLYQVQGKLYYKVTSHGTFRGHVLPRISKLPKITRFWPFALRRSIVVWHQSTARDRADGSPDSQYFDWSVQRKQPSPIHFSAEDQELLLKI